jgi:hypothetical protein
MRVALCLSGQARGIHITWNSFLENIINPTNCDIFISFANDASLVNVGKIDLMYTEIELVKDPSLEYLYSIARGDVEYITHLGDMGKECTNLAVLRQAYSVNRANKMKIEYEKKNNFVYDWVIRSRADVVIGSNIGDLSALDDTYIYSPDTNTHRGLNDFFAYGSSKNMDVYCDRINQMKRIDSPPFPFFNPHMELDYVLRMNNIDVKFIPLNIKREREWRGKDDINCHRFYGEYGKKVIEGRLKRQNERM